MADVSWFTGSIRFVARFLRAYPLMQISTAAALWTPVSVGLQYGLEVAGWTEIVDLSTKGLGVPVSSAGIAGVAAFILVGAVQHFKRSAYRKQRAEATQIRLRKSDEKAQRALQAQAAAAEGERLRVSAAFAGMSLEMHLVFRRAIELRQSTINVSGLGPGVTAAARQLDSMGYVRFYDDYGVRSLHSATVVDSVYKFLLSNPQLVGSDAAILVHRDQLELP